MTLPILRPPQLLAPPIDGDVDASLAYLRAIYREHEVTKKLASALNTLGLEQALDMGSVLLPLRLNIDPSGNETYWKDWVRKHVPFSYSSARVYMRLARYREAIEADSAVSSIRAAIQLCKRLDRAAKCQALRDPGPLPCGRFNLIAIDIPWWFTGNWLPYKTMTREQVFALMAELEKRVADDATAFFWFPDTFLGDVIPVIEAAGFEYHKRVLVWVKTNGRAPHSDVMGGHELIAMATRGKSVRDPGSDTVIHAPRGAHSEKPDEAYERFERIAPSNPSTRLELFAREPRAGWVTWGDQLPEESEPESTTNKPLALPAPANPA